MFTLGLQHTSALLVIRAPLLEQIFICIANVFGQSVRISVPENAHVAVIYEYG